MEIIKYPTPSTWPALLARPAANQAAATATAQEIMHAVQAHGDAAVATYNTRFNEFAGPDFYLPKSVWEAAGEKLSPDLKKAIQRAAANIEAFHTAQNEEIKEIETTPGVRCWRKSVGIERVGIYIPGGTAPLFSTVLMLAIPARLAGCTDIVLCTPADALGHVHPAIVYAASLTGVTALYRAGGAQAIAALAHGTQTLPPVHKIFGPGNAYVTAAKMLAQQSGVAIDMPAGPSEVAILADASSHPAFVAADLLSQAEHGPDSQVLLVSDSEAVLQAVNQELTAQLAALPRQATATLALANSKAVLVSTLEAGMALLNAYAPEHLILAVAHADDWAEHVRHAGSVFLGHYTPESAGDYASGTNHTLPTHGYARAYSGVSLDSFVKKITFQHITPAGLQYLGPTITHMAEAEGLAAHAAAVSVRLANI